MLLYVTGVNDIGLRQVRGVLLDAFFQGYSGEPGRGFYLDGRYGFVLNSAR